LSKSIQTAKSCPDYPLFGPTGNDLIDMTDTEALDRCRRQIEAQLGWCPGERWTTHDFTRLSELIFEATGINLSVNTLKRIWGRIAYQSSPNPTTLDALAGFLGHPNWRAFHQAQAAESTPDPQPEPPARPAAPGKPLRQLRPGIIWSAGLLMGIAVAYGLAFSLRSTKTQPAPAYEFESRIVAEGLPNSVIFTYDASAAPTDCVAIQQSWDPSRRFVVDRQKHQVSSIYYYPGFYRAGLVVDGKVVKNHPLLIQTQGWLPLIERSPVPVYFKPEQALRKGQLGLSPQQIEAVNVPLQPTPPWVSYYWVGDWSHLSSDNFTLDTQLKNDYAEGSGTCQHTELVVLCQNNAFVLPFSRPGCVSALTLHVVDQHLTGDKNDLSAFGCDFSDWVGVRCEVRNKTLRVFLNGKAVYQLRFQNEAGPLVGLCYRFQGTGSVRAVRLTDGAGKIVFTETFG